MNSPRVNNFDNIAGVYDLLAKLVFGKSIRAAQCAMLSDLSGSRNILIIGGGTGWLLEEVLKSNKAGQVWYVDASAKMLEKARQRCIKFDLNRVRLIQGTEHDLPDQPTFDAVIANFYFDMFSPARLTVMIQRLQKAMRGNALMIATDFTLSQQLWHSILLYVMYAFFRGVTNLEARSLPPWQMMLETSGFKEAKSEKFYDGFIESKKYLLQ